MFSFKPFSAKSFDIGHVKGNIKELLKLEAGAWLTSYGTGALRAVYSLKGKALLLLKHLCTAGLSTCKTKAKLGIHKPDYPPKHYMGKPREPGPALG